MAAAPSHQGLEEERTVKEREREREIDMQLAFSPCLDFEWALRVGSSIYIICPHGSSSLAYCTQYPCLRFGTHDPNSELFFLS